MRKTNLTALVEAGIMTALSYLLNLITLFTMPQGGSISAGAMVPIIIMGVRRGPAWGVATGIATGIVQFILGPKFSYHPVSIILDYVLAYAVIGLIGYFGKNKLKISIGIFVVVFARFVCHVLSGVIVFASFAEGQNPWIYSIIYNGSFLIPELIITLIISLALISNKRIIEA